MKHFLFFSFSGTLLESGCVHQTENLVWPYRFNTFHAVFTYVLFLSSLKSAWDLIIMCSIPLEPFHLLIVKVFESIIWFWSCFYIWMTIIFYIHLNIVTHTYYIHRKHEPWHISSLINPTRYLLHQATS